MSTPLPQIPFGTGYFRKSNPPREDWEHDYKVAAEDGLNVFRYWFMWSIIERRPGQYDWDNYDRHMDLATENGLKTIIAEFTQSAPDWMLRKFPEARQRRFDGRLVDSIPSQSTATGGFARNGGGAGTMTMNDGDVLEATRAFLTELANRYKNHPGRPGL